MSNFAAGLITGIAFGVGFFFGLVAFAIGTSQIYQRRRR